MAEPGSRGRTFGGILAVETVPMMAGAIAGYRAPEIAKGAYQATSRFGTRIIETRPFQTGADRMTVNWERAFGRIEPPRVGEEMPLRVGKSTGSVSFRPIRDPVSGKLRNPVQYKRGVWDITDNVNYPVTGRVRDALRVNYAKYWAENPTPRGGGWRPTTESVSEGFMSPQKTVRVDLTRGMEDLGGGDYIRRGSKLATLMDRGVFAKPEPGTGGLPFGTSPYPKTMEGVPFQRGAGLRTSGEPTMKGGWYPTNDMILSKPKPAGRGAPADTGMDHESGLLTIGRGIQRISSGVRGAMSSSRAAARVPKLKGGSGVLLTGQSATPIFAPFVSPDISDLKGGISSVLSAFRSGRESAYEMQVSGGWKSDQIYPTGFSRIAIPQARGGVGGREGLSVSSSSVLQGVERAAASASKPFTGSVPQQVERLVQPNARRRRNPFISIDEEYTSSEVQEESDRRGIIGLRPVLSAHRISTTPKITSETERRVIPAVSPIVRQFEGQVPNLALVPSIGLANFQIPSTGQVNLQVPAMDQLNLQMPAMDQLTLQQPAMDQMQIQRPVLDTFTYQVPAFEPPALPPFEFPPMPIPVIPPFTPPPMAGAGGGGGGGIGGFRTGMEFVETMPLGDFLSDTFGGAGLDFGGMQDVSSASFMSGAWGGAKPKKTKRRKR